MTMPRNYHREYSRKYYHKRKNKLIEMLGDVCQKCGSKKGLQFDHKDPTNRKFKIGKLLNYSKELVLKEIKKCQLLCEKCHINKSINEGSFRKNRLKGIDSPRAKLTEKDVRSILATLDTNTNIAKNFNVSRGTIWHIKNNRTWKHINL